MEFKPNDTGWRYCWVRLRTGGGERGLPARTLFERGDEISSTACFIPQQESIVVGFSNCTSVVPCLILNGSLTFNSFRVSEHRVSSEDIINRETQKTGFMDTGSGLLLNVHNKFHRGVSQISESFCAITLRWSDSRWNKSVSVLQGVQTVRTVCVCVRCVRHVCVYSVHGMCVCTVCVCEMTLRMFGLLLKVRPQRTTSPLLPSEELWQQALGAVKELWSCFFSEVQSCRMDGSSCRTSYGVMLGPSTAWINLL